MFSMEVPLKYNHKNLHILGLIYRVSQKKVYTCIMAYYFHMEVNIWTWMTNIGRITFTASFNTIFVKKNSRLIS